jgi:hypothetical protein
VVPAKWCFVHLSEGHSPSLIDIDNVGLTLSAKARRRGSSDYIRRHPEHLYTLHSPPGGTKAWIVSVRVVVDYVVPLVGQRHMEQVSIKETESKWIPPELVVDQTAGRMRYKVDAMCRCWI